MKQLVKKFLLFFGLKLTKVQRDLENESNWGHPITVDFLRRFANKTDVLIDVGANRGMFARAYNHFSPSRNWFLFEPIPVLANYLKSAFSTKEVVILQKAISDEPSTEVNFHISENDGQSSSLLKMGLRHLEVSPDSRQLETVQVSVSTLDEELKWIPFSRAFLKVDVQGSELNVFRGAQETLKRVVAIHTEVSLTSLYENDSMATEVIEFLVSQGFIVYGIDPWFRDFKSSGELLQADVLFIKPQLLAEAK